MRNTRTKIRSSRIITAVSAIIFSIIGIGAVTGQMTLVYPEAGAPAIKRSRIEPNITPLIVVNRVATQNTETTDPCADCAVVDSITMKETEAARAGAGLASARVGHETAATSSYLVKVRMNDGSYRVVSQQDLPIFHVGEKVKIVNGAIVPLDGPALTDRKRMFALMLATLTSRMF